MRWMRAMDAANDPTRGTCGTRRGGWAGGGGRLSQSRLHSCRGRLRGQATAVPDRRPGDTLVDRE